MLANLVGEGRQLPAQQANEITSGWKVLFTQPL
jgi:hypothetical protein